MLWCLQWRSEHGISKLHQKELLQGEEGLKVDRWGAEELASRSRMLCSEVSLILEMTMKGVVFWFRLDIQGLGARRDSLSKYEWQNVPSGWSQPLLYQIRTGSAKHLSGTVTIKEDGICESYPNLMWRVISCRKPVPTYQEMAGAGCLNHHGFQYPRAHKQSEWGIQHSFLKPASMLPCCRPLCKQCFILRNVRLFSLNPDCKVAGWLQCSS